MARCGRCKVDGHNERTCTERESPITRRIAELRLQSDALAIEIVQYQSVRDVADRRISENRQRIADVAIVIERLRSGTMIESRSSESFVEHD